ncbi:Uncharacterised protein [Enterococcus faecium]|nr:Uncharacterised protein [Enterococcus faecium]
MGIDFINVEFRKHVKVSGDLGTTGSVCPFHKTKNGNTTGKLFASFYIMGKIYESIAFVKMHTND